MRNDEHEHPIWSAQEPPAETAQRPGLAWEQAMKLLNRVVVATDFSPGARRAVARAAWLPFAPGATIHLVHAIAPGEDETAAAAALEALRVEVAALAAERARAGGSPLDIRFDVLQGDAYGEISRVGLENDSDVVVVGRHGRRGISAHFLGSTAEQVVRKGRLPVIVVNDRPTGPYRHPLFATDFEETADRVLATLLRVTRSSAGQVTVVHAIEEVPGDGPLVAGVSHEEASRYYDAQLAQAVGDMSALGRRFETTEVKLDLVVRAGIPVSVVIDEAQARGCDLVAVGTRARSGLPRLLLGTTAGSVLREAPCDVLVVPLRD